ncbi:MAG: hypothetical protein IPK07_13220 [Deltaproteobacteria bacterium]|jgi:nucleoside-diphosphate-sugar epimerase|nr:hypothetical protein [Deltaproteobacteria bacterium]
MTVPDRRRERPTILVLGGTGEVGASVVAESIELGLRVAAASRRPPQPLLEQSLFGPHRVRWERIAEPNGATSAALKELMAEHDIVILACEPWRVEPGDERSSIDEARARLETAAAASEARLSAGLPPLRVVRIGSPAAELPFALMGSRGDGFEEDAIRLQEVAELAKRDLCWRVPYFVAKVGMALAAREAVRTGLDLVTAAPTGTVSWWGDKGAEDLWVRAHHECVGAVPLISFPTNVLPGDVAARGILLVALAGVTGHVYQVPGVVWHSWDLQIEMLRHTRRTLPPAFHLTRELILEGVRVHLEERGPVDRLKRRWLRELVGARDYAMAALLQNNRARSAAKLLSLVPKLAADGPPLEYPSPAEIAAALPAAARRRAQWLTKRGLLRRGGGRAGSPRTA